MTKRNILLLAGLVLFLIGLKFCLPFETKIWEDHDIAVNLVTEGEMYYESDGARNHTFQFPIYSSCLALGYFLFGIHKEWGIALNIIMHAFSVFLFMRLFGLLLNNFFRALPGIYKKAVMYISAAVFFLHPAILVYTLFHVHPLAFNIFSLFAGLYFSLQFAFQPSRKKAVIAGLVLGICMLDRATVVLTLVPAAILLIHKISFREYIKNFLVLLSVATAVISPWLVRNYLTDGIIGFESSAAKNIWKGVLYNSEGGNYLLNGDTYYAALSEKEISALGEMSPMEQRNFFRDRYYEILKNDPGHVAMMFLVKLKNYWWFRTNAGEEWGNLRNYLVFYKLVYTVILLLMICLLFLNPKEMIVLLSFPIALSVLQSCFYVEMRHRIALEPLFIFLAVVSFYFIREKYFMNKKAKHE